MVLLLHWLGVSLANESPPCAPDGSRFFGPVGHIAPQMERTAQRWVASVGGPGNADRILPGNVFWPWLRRALSAFEVLLKNGACVLPNGLLPVPAIKSGDHALFSALQCVDALLAGRATLVRWVAPWCNGCTCSSRSRLSACLLAVALRSAKLSRPRQLQTDVLDMFRHTVIAEAEAFAQVGTSSVCASSGADSMNTTLADELGTYAALSLVMPLMVPNHWNHLERRGFQCGSRAML